MAAHRYWRIYVTATGGGANCCINEIEMHTSVGGADVCSGGTAIESGHYSTYAAANAFDNNLSDLYTWWSVAISGGPVWVGYDFGAGNTKDIVEVRLYSFATQANYNANNFSIDYSDNGTSWTTASSVTGAYAGWATHTWKTFAVVTPPPIQPYGGIPGFGSLAQAPLAGSAGPPITGTLSVTEAADQAAFAATVKTTFALAATETADQAAFAATVKTTLALAATEAADAAAFSVSPRTTLALSVTEAADQASFAATAVLTLALAATEAADTAAFLGFVRSTFTLAATEAADQASFAALTRSTIVLAATEAADAAAFAALVSSSFVLAATEAADAAAFAVNPPPDLGHHHRKFFADVATLMGS